MLLQVGLWLMLAAWCLGAVASVLFLSKRPILMSRIAYLFAALGSGVGAILALQILFKQEQLSLILWSVAPGLQFSFIWDQWSGFFLLVVTVVAFFVSLYALGMVKSAQGNGRQEAFVGLGYNLFLLTMVMVLGASDSFSFLVMWEVMSLVSFLLVMTYHERKKVRRAGLTYVIMTHLGTGFLMVGFLILYLVTGSLEFAAYRELGALIDPGMKHILFFLFLVGFGTKAGLIPLHIWLPQAHPVAPSHVSALLSAVMIKTAVYGMLRFVFDFMGVFPFWWGAVLFGLGIVSAVIGILYGVVQKEMKRLLAYSSVENMGLIFIGIGMAMMLGAKGHFGMASLPLFAVMFHVFNHALFKSLLFMGAGAVLQSTGEGRMDRLGGLIHVMPQTSILFLIGTLAISAMPLLNGFVSKWLLFRSLVETASLGDPVLAGIGLFAAAILVLVGTLVALGFVKLFGVTFLAQPRTRFKKPVEEAPLAMRIGMSGAAGVTLILGLFPGILINQLHPLISRVAGEEQIAISSTGIWGLFSLAHEPTGINTVPLTGDGGLFPLFVLLILAAVIVVTMIILRWIGGPSRRETTETWACGIKLAPAMSYTGRSFSHPMLVIFKGLFDTRHHVRKEEQTLHFGLQVRNFFMRSFYQPMIHGVINMAAWIRRIQDGRIHAYLAYLFITLIVLLIWSSR